MSATANRSSSAAPSLPRADTQSARDRLRATLRLPTNGLEKPEPAADARHPEQHATAAARSSRGATAVAKQATHAARKRSREPRHIAPTHSERQQRGELAAREQRHAASTDREDHASRGRSEETKPDGPESHQHRAMRAPGRGHKHVYCGNNALAPELTSGGAIAGTRSQCFRRGVGAGLHAAIPPGGEDEFIAKWTAPYRKLVDQPLHYGDGHAPAGKFPATLSQCLARGFAVGSIQKAKKLLARRGEHAQG